MSLFSMIWDDWISELLTMGGAGNPGKLLIRITLLHSDRRFYKEVGAKEKRSFVRCGKSMCYLADC